MVVALAPNDRPNVSYTTSYEFEGRRDADVRAEIEELIVDSDHTLDTKTGQIYNFTHSYFDRPSISTFQSGDSTFVSLSAAKLLSG